MKPGAEPVRADADAQAHRRAVARYHLALLRAIRTGRSPATPTDTRQKAQGVKRRQLRPGPLT